MKGEVCLWCWDPIPKEAIPDDYEPRVQRLFCEPSCFVSNWLFEHWFDECMKVTELELELRKRDEP